MHHLPSPSLQTLLLVLTFTLAHLLTPITAHGFPSQIIVGSTTYPGAQFDTSSGSSSASPVRKVSTGDPVQDVTSDDMICGWSAASSAAASISVSPGELMQVWWSGESAGDNWPHLTGPVNTYMTSCSSSCSSFTPSASTAWFKTSELGQTSSDPSSTSWAQGTIASGLPANVTIPSNLPPGEYLMRHEIISLQNAETQGLAEFYPSCIQVTVSGSGGGKALSPGSTVNFPGAYSATDPGILVNVYGLTAAYVFPGGPVSSYKDPLTNTNDAATGAVAVASGSSSSSSSSSDSSSSSSSSSSSDSPSSESNPTDSTGTNDTPSMQCALTLNINPFSDSLSNSVSLTARTLAEFKMTFELGAKMLKRGFEHVVGVFTGTPNAGRDSERKVRLVR